MILTVFGGVEVKTFLCLPRHNLYLLKTRFGLGEAEFPRSKDGQGSPICDKLSTNCYQKYIVSLEYSENLKKSLCKVQGCKSILMHLLFGHSGCNVFKTGKLLLWK